MHESIASTSASTCKCAASTSISLASVQQRLRFPSVSTVSIPFYDQLKRRFVLGTGSCAPNTVQSMTKCGTTGSTEACEVVV